MAVNEAPKQKKTSMKLVIFLLIVIIALIGGGLAYFKYEFFKVKAEGIAIGYAKAATAAAQMGRPIPDSIFEEGNYRVEIKSNPGQDITVNVKDLYSNMTHYSLTRPLGAAAVR